MSTVYRKTAKGQAEIDTRAYRLLPRLRQALILVDGRAPTPSWPSMILAEPAVTLSHAADRRLHRSPGHGGTTRHAANASPSAAPTCSTAA